MKSLDITYEPSRYTRGPWWDALTTGEREAWWIAEANRQYHRQLARQARKARDIIRQRGQRRVVRDRQWGAANAEQLLGR